MRPRDFNRSWTSKFHVPTIQPVKRRPVRVTSYRDHEPNRADTLSSRYTHHKSVEDDFELEEIVGEGAFGTVHAARCRATSKRYAVKTRTADKKNGVPKLSDIVNEEITNEAMFLTAAKHENCLSLHALYIHPDDNTYSIVTELCHGLDLFEYVVDYYRKNVGIGMKERDALLVIKQILQAIDSCHRAGFAHLDIKLENFVFQKTEEEISKLNADLDSSPDSKPVENILKLVDFGSASWFERAGYAESSGDYREGFDDEYDLQKLTGTAYYVPPEVWQGRFSSRSDVWSVGVVAYTMICGVRPFENATHTKNMSASEVERHVEFNIRTNPTVKFTEPAWGGVSKETQELIKGMLQPASMARSSAAEALELINERLL